MNASMTLILTCGVLFGTGVYLLLARSVIRALIGFLLMSNGVNLLFLVASGRAGRAPIIGTSSPDEMSDPVPQAMVLTAIVIGLCMTAFMLALAHRAWQLSNTDVLDVDTEDARITRRAQDDDMSESDFDETGQNHTVLDDANLAETHDELEDEDGNPVRAEEVDAVAAGATPISEHLAAEDADPDQPGTDEGGNR
ncbi:Na(+)/H(+) antiporter subunit C [Dermacoccaceae bacterium W4C1]